MAELSKKTKGIGCFGLMAFFTAIIFTVLKIFGALTWSWWWITALAWGFILLGILWGVFLFVVVSVLTFIALMLSPDKNEKE